MLKENLFGLEIDPRCTQIAAFALALGGALTTWAGWQLIFWINVPVGAAALIVALKILPKDKAAPASATRFDLLRHIRMVKTPDEPTGMSVPAV